MPMTSDGPTVTFGSSVAESVAEELGFEVADDGTILGPDGDPAPSVHGGAITIDDCGGFVENQDGDIVVVGDSYVDVVEVVSSDEYDV